MAKEFCKNACIGFHWVTLRRARGEVGEDRIVAQYIYGKQHQWIFAAKMRAEVPTAVANSNHETSLWCATRLMEQG